jgi:acyl carrier protein
MTNKEIERIILQIMEEEFEIVSPDPDVNLGDVYEFDSIDALEMLSQLEQITQLQLTMDEKKRLFDYRTINQICGYLSECVAART